MVTCEAGAIPLLRRGNRGSQRKVTGTEDSVSTESRRGSASNEWKQIRRNLKRKGRLTGKEQGFTALSAGRATAGPGDWPESRPDQV